MSRQWRPGDAATVAGTWRTGDGVEERRATREGSGWDSFEGAYLYDSDVVGEPRPLAVIDPADREQVERLHRLRREAGGQRVERTQNALREFAKPTPPKPDEPTGLGAVVMDIDGSELVRVAHGHPRPWQAAGGHRFSWDEIDFLAVVGPGADPLAAWEIDLLRGAR